jgi:hypothetical protein
MAHDLYAEIAQSAVDKLLDSTSYPLTLFEKNQGFPGCDSLQLQQEGSIYKYSDKETDDLFAAAMSTVVLKNKKASAQDAHLNEQIFAFAGSIIEQTKKALDATASPDYEGPSRADLETLINDGLPSLTTNLRKLFGEFGAYAWCSHLKVTVRQRPNLHLSAPRIDLKNLRVEGSATGELWVKYPWLNCYKWCLKWEKVSKCDRIASASVAIDVASDAHVDLFTQGAKVYGKGSFDKLRLDYPILRDIPLEGIANSALGGSSVLVYDASKLIETVPILQSTFAISAIDIPPQANALGIGVTIQHI